MPCRVLFVGVIFGDHFNIGDKIQYELVRSLVGYAELGKSHRFYRWHFYFIVSPNAGRLSSFIFEVMLVSSCLSSFWFIFLL
jgi:hypothetical protein